jgi:hypothetical protein
VVGGAVEAEQRSDRTLTVRGLTLDRGLAVGHGDFVLSELVVRTHPTILTSGISIDSDLLGMSGGTMTMLVDRCDISGSTHAVFVDNSQFNPADIAITVQDSWLHSDWTNVYVLSRQIPTFWQTEVVLDHNTIQGLGVWPGLDANANTSGALDLTYTNNMFEGHSVAVDLEPAVTVLAGDHSAFWDNGAAFAGAAIAGAGDVFADCDLDDSTPPVPGPSSPCVDAAAAGGPAVDFWGLDRVGAPDIGAVER